MKYIISESKIESVIREYLDDNYYPDYGWLEPEVYKEEFEKWDEIYFEVNDHARYKYVSGKLTVGQSPDLDGYFGKLWRPVFITWFENTFSLPIKTLKH